MTSKQQTGLTAQRVHGPSTVNIDSLTCAICHDVLWKPVACQSCETPFCSTCIHQWLVHNPNKCPNRCQTYIERKCPPFIAKLLAQLQINCFYQSNGCEQTVSYEALDKHEDECEYQLRQCSGCQSEILKKDFIQHDNDCELVEWACSDCKLVCKKSDVALKHTENNCLKDQLRQLRKESKQNQQNLQKLIYQWKRICILNPEFTKVIIKFDDLSSAINECKIIPSIYRGLKWTGIFYGHELYLKNNFPNSGYVSAFTDGNSSQLGYFKSNASIESENSDEAFTLISMTVCAAWNDNLQLTITGYRNSIPIHTHTTILTFGQPQVIVLQWNNINKITFQPSGGTAHPGSGQPPLPHVIVTQITLDALV